MRCRLTVAALVAASMLLANAGPVSAQSSGGGDTDGGSDQSAGGSILGGGDELESYAGDGASSDPTRATRGGGNVVCRYYTDSHVGPVDITQPETPEMLAVRADGLAVLFVRICEDSVTGDVISWQEGIALELPAVDPIDPQQLALMARSRLPFPLPEVAFSPPLVDQGDFLLVNLETWLWVENWQPFSASATAGGVVVTATATPVRQAWDFAPGRPAPELEGGCDGPGTRYDTARPAEGQSTDCGFTFVHSSAGQPGDAYEGRLSVVWEVTWTSNIGAGGDLGEVTRTTVQDVRVGEQQALNESGGGA